MQFFSAFFWLKANTKKVINLKSGNSLFILRFLLFTKLSSKKIKEKCTCKKIECLKFQFSQTKLPPKICVAEDKLLKIGKVEKILKGSLDSISLPSPSVKI